MTGKARALLVCIGMSCAAGPVPAGSPDLSGASVSRLRVDRPRPEGRILVSFEIDGALTEEVRERIHSGIEMSFRHRVDLLSKRAFPLWPRKLVGRTVVTTTVQYDSLTRRYRLERETGGKSWPKEQTPPESVESRSTSSAAEMESWMTDVEEVALPSPPDRQEARLKVRVRSELGRRFVFYLVPWTYAATAELSLEF